MNSATFPQVYGRYYGDEIRKFYILAAFLMLLLMPYLAKYIPAIPLISIGGSIILVIMAASLNKFSSTLFIFSSGASAAGVGIFEIYSIQAFPSLITFSMVNQMLAVIFCITLYLSLKTYRAMFLVEKNIGTEQQILNELKKEKTIAAIEQNIIYNLSKELNPALTKQFQFLQNLMQEFETLKTEEKEDFSSLVNRLEELRGSINELEEELGNKYTPQNKSIGS